MLSVPHLVVIFVIALVVFGPQKLPELARTLGKLMAEFRKASGDFRSAFEEEMRDLERQARETERKLKEAARLPETITPVTPPSTESPTEATLARDNPIETEYPEERIEDKGDQAAQGQQSDELAVSSSESLLAECPLPPPEVSSNVAAGDFTPREDDHLGPQTEHDNSETLTKSDHVNRQPA